MLLTSTKKYQVVSDSNGKFIVIENSSEMNGEVNSGVNSVINDGVNGNSGVNGSGVNGGGVNVIEMIKGSGVNVNVNGVSGKLKGAIEASSKRLIAHPSLFESSDPKLWEEAYQQVMDPKYKKNTRNFSREVKGNEWKGTGAAPIFLIPRERGGPSYKSAKLRGVTSDDVYYCPISKGFSMQNVSSFTLGPFVGEGLCLVNAAFSKSICIMHIEGGGFVNLKRKCFWQSARKPLRDIKVIDAERMSVDGKEVNILIWLQENENLWVNDWEVWRKYVALCGRGDFHWDGDSPCLAFRYKNKCIGFVEWKKECYIRPSYGLLPSTDVFQYLMMIWKEKKRPIGLVHPKAYKLDSIEEEITPDALTMLFNSDIMSCQPYVVAGLMLGVEI